MSDIQFAIDKHISTLASEGKFSGSVLVAMDGNIILSKGYGMANYELDVPNEPQTVFRIGSATKSFTATVVMQLCEKGVLHLDDTVDKYLPTYPNGNVISIHHLLTHSGVRL